MRQLGLDRVWWLVGPGNPLKDRGRLPSPEARAGAARALARHPRMVVSDVEARLDLRFSVETIRYLRWHRPGVRFVCIMGADSFANLHRWKAWREIAKLVPIAVVDRPGWSLRAQRSRAAATLASARRTRQGTADLARAATPAWTFLSGRRSNLSSTALRGKTLKDLDLR